MMAETGQWEGWEQEVGVTERLNGDELAWTQDSGTSRVTDKCRKMDGCCAETTGWGEAELRKIRGGCGSAQDRRLIKT